MLDLIVGLTLMDPFRMRKRPSLL